MPANLTPEYKAAEASYRQAREPKERLEWLREMLRTMPKHKGTDHLQAEVKTRIKELTEQLASGKKGGARSAENTSIHPEGAAQILLLGPPNSGKSTLHARLTGSNAAVGPYPFTTQLPQAGMLEYADIHFQLLDMPPLSPEHPIPWLANSLQQADACLLVVDLGDPECVDQLAWIHRLLAEKRVTLLAEWPRGLGPEREDELEDPFSLRLPTLLLVNKTDTLPQVDEELSVLRELTGLSYPALRLSSLRGDGLDQLGPWLFEQLGVVRVYTKVPGQPPDMGRPFTLRRGQRVEDVARMVHRDLVHSLRYARVWGGGQFNGQQVGREYQVSDGEILELHG